MSESDLFFAENHIRVAIEFAKSLSTSVFPHPTSDRLDRFMVGCVNQVHHYATEGEKSFHVWYNVTKSHFLVDGNKRIGLACFLIYCHLIGKEATSHSKSFSELSEWIASQNPEQPGSIKEDVIATLNREVSLGKRINIFQEEN